MYKAFQISPMIPSYDIAKTVGFFKDLFGFDAELDTPGYAVLRKDEQSIHILNAGTDIGQMEFYFAVNDVDTLWQSIENKVGDTRVRPPFNREYGMREFHIVVPHTNTLMFVGQVIGV